MVDNLYVDIVSPHGSVFGGEAAGVKAPGVEGSFEILRDHAPMISAFEIGKIVLSMPTGEKLVFATSGGFLEVLNNTVTVLAESAEAASEIDIARAEAAEEKARRRLEEAGDSEEKARAAAALRRARNRLRNGIGSVGS